MGNASPDALRRAIQAVIDANDLDGAVDALIASLRDDYELWAATLSVFLPSGTAKVVASLAPGDTILTVGTEIAIDLTPEILGYVQDLLAGRPILVSTRQEGLGLLGELLPQEGWESVVTVPLADQGEVVAVLSLASSSAQGFSQSNLDFFRGLGRALETALLRLVDRSGRV